MRIAISYLQNRISPVFDVAARILLVDIDKGQEKRRNERTVVHSDSLARAQYVSQLGVQVLICGAISWRLENALSSTGVQVIACICGPVDDVLKAFLKDKLSESAFIMPGCLCRRQPFKYKREGAMEKPIINSG